MLLNPERIRDTNEEEEINRLSCQCCQNNILNYIGSKEGYKFYECFECHFTFADGVQYKEMVDTYR